MQPIISFLELQQGKLGLLLKNDHTKPSEDEPNVIAKNTNVSSSYQTEAVK
jgi:hypothetical protein